MRKRQRNGLSAACLLLLAGCDGGGWHARAPARTPPPELPTAPISTIAATLTVSASDIAEQLNKTTAVQIVSIRDQPVKCGIGKCRLDLNAERAGAITATARDGKLHVVIPFDADAKTKLPGIAKGISADIRTRGQATLDTDVTIRPDWRIRPHTDGIVHLDGGRLRIGPLKTNLAKLWNKNAETFSHPLFRRIDKQIASGLKLERQVDKLWRTAAKPIRIGTKPAIWLTLAPERIRIAQPHFANDALTLSLGIDVRARTYLQNAAPQPSAPSALPPPAPLAGRQDRFSLLMPLVLPYDRAAELALAALRKEKKRTGNKILSIAALEILPSGKDVVVAARFCLKSRRDVFGWFAACGTGYLRGTPVFDAAKNVIRFDRLQYDVQSENIVLGAIRPLAADAIKRELTKGFRFDVSKPLRRIRRQLEKGIGSPQGEHLALSGRLDRFEARSLTWTRTGFVALFAAEGDVRASWRP